MGVHGHVHLDMVSIGIGHLFGPLSNMDHPLVPKTEMVQLVMPIWTMDGSFDSYTFLFLFSRFFGSKVWVVLIKKKKVWVVRLKFRNTQLLSVVPAYTGITILQNLNIHYLFKNYHFFNYITSNYILRQSPKNLHWH